MSSYPSFMQDLPIGSIFFIILFYGFLILVGIWTFIWKSIALWKSARDDELVWFILMLFFSAMGILPIIYIFVIHKQKKKSPDSYETTEDQYLVENAPVEDKRPNTNENIS